MDYKTIYNKVTSFFKCNRDVTYMSVKIKSNNQYVDVHFERDTSENCGYTNVMGFQDDCNEECGREE